MSGSTEPFGGRNVRWYPRTSANTPLASIHKLAIYQNRFWDIRDEVPNFEPAFNFTKFTRCINSKPVPRNPEGMDSFRSKEQYERCLEVGDFEYNGDENTIFDNWDELTSEDWDLPAFVVFPGAADTGDEYAGETDRVAVMQKNPDSVVKSDMTSDCLLVFQGSGGMSDMGRFMNFGLGDYCGQQVHKGVRNELTNMVMHEDWQETIVPALKDCASVSAVGHSLGGSLADMVTMCINFGDKESDDYKNLVW